MAVPKRRTSKSKKGMRRAHDGKSAPQWQRCPDCQQAKPSHSICPNCGSYMGRKLIDDEE